MLTKLFLRNNEILPCRDIQVASLIVDSLPPLKVPDESFPTVFIQTASLEDRGLML